MSDIMTRVKNILPPSVRTTIRRWRNVPMIRDTLFDLYDGWDRLLLRHDPLMPPRRLVHGIGSSLDVGATYLRHFQQLADLQPDERILDVGCGIGRMALPLTRFLTSGSYEGFDIMKSNVAWCQQAITPRFPHFQFQHADIYNREYNPEGRLAGSTYRFPYADAGFDFAYLTSVFTHLLPEDAAHYLAELARVLRPGGRCLATFFLLNDESNRRIDAGQACFAFAPAKGPVRVSNPLVPEACVALDETFILDQASRYGFEPQPAIHYGSWSGRDEWFDSQDIMLLRKP